MQIDRIARCVVYDVWVRVASRCDEPEVVWERIAVCMTRLAAQTRAAEWERGEGSAATVEARYITPAA